MTESTDQSVSFPFYPEVHSVTGNQLRPLNLVQNFKLQFRINIGEKHVFSLAIGFRQLRVKCFEYVKVGLQRLSLVQVITVTALPTESLTWLGLQSGKINTSRAEKFFRLFREVVTNNSNQLNTCEETSGGGEISR